MWDFLKKKDKSNSSDDIYYRRFHVVKIEYGKVYGYFQHKPIDFKEAIKIASIEKNGYVLDMQTMTIHKPLRKGIYG